MPYTVTGPTEVIAEALFGPPQHDAHCRGWRYHFYLQDQTKLEARLNAELRKMIAERREARGIADALEAAE